MPHLAGAIAVYRIRIGEQRGHVRNAARMALEGLRPDRVEGVIKLLDDVATYQWPSGQRQSEQRLEVFLAAANRHPVLEQTAARSFLRTAVDTLPDQPDQLVALLYADYPEFHRLAAFPTEYSAEDLRDDYDLAQAQALLYDAVSVELNANADFKHIVQYARLSRLLHRIQRVPGGYRFSFDGPNSLLRRTHAYGVDFAKFLAAVVQARGWEMRARLVLRKGWRPVNFRLAACDGLRSRVPAPRLFDSQLEESLAEKFGTARSGWRLRREALVLEAGTTLAVPDFVFTHEDGTEVALEIVGYWTPEYLSEKMAKLAKLGRGRVLVAVRQKDALSAGILPHPILPFKSRLLLKDLMPRLEAFRHASAG